MCCLFGFLDYEHKLTRKQRSRLLTVLSTACEERGTDATGIAYNADGRLHIFKRPLPAHLMWYRVPLEATAVMGHTRMTTQGSEKKNQNNHPFFGKAGDTRFALAHNGVLSNDRLLRKKKKLPVTRIETDSYVAVQLLERHGELSFKSLQDMADELEGTFTFTVLSDKDELYFVMGNNPMCIYHFPALGIYVYASTEAILLRAIHRLTFMSGKQEKVHIFCGDILRIDSKGRITQSTFDDSKIAPSYSSAWSYWPGYSCCHEDAYLSDLKAVASCYGIYPEDVDALLRDGVSMEEIEEYIYCG